MNLLGSPYYPSLLWESNTDRCLLIAALFPARKKSNQETTKNARNREIIQAQINITAKNEHSDGIHLGKKHTV